MPFTGIPVSTVLCNMLSSHRAMECTTIAPPARMFWINVRHGARGSHLRKRSFDPLSKWTLENRNVSPAIIQMERGKLKCACMQANQRCVFACTRMCKSMPGRLGVEAPAWKLSFDQAQVEHAQKHWAPKAQSNANLNYGGGSSNEFQ